MDRRKFIIGMVTLAGFGAVVYGANEAVRQNAENVLGSADAPEAPVNPPSNENGNTRVRNLADAFRARNSSSRVFNVDPEAPSVLRRWLDGRFSR